MLTNGTRVRLLSNGVEGTVMFFNLNSRRYQVQFSAQSIDYFSADQLEVV